MGGRHLRQVHHRPLPGVGQDPGPDFLLGGPAVKENQNERHSLTKWRFFTDMVRTFEFVPRASRRYPDNACSLGEYRE